jgi:hemoglobin-like flavoprotein
MTPQQIDLVQASFSLVQPIAPQAAAIFYEQLFTRDPGLRRLFKGDMEDQGAKLMQMIGWAVQRLRQPEVLLPALKGLGRRHAGYGVQDSHYATVGAALLDTLALGLGAAFTDDVRQAWTAMYGVVAQTMQQAAREEPVALV